MPVPNCGVSTKPYAPATPPVFVTVMVYTIGFAPTGLAITLSMRRLAGKG